MVESLARNRVAKLRDGRVISRSDLPPPDARWTASRRKLVVDLITADIITAPEARERYSLTRAELAGWFTS